MTAGWTAATLRAAALARGRAGQGRCEELAALPSLGEALEGLSGTVYAPFVAPEDSTDRRTVGAGAAAGASPLERAAHGTRAAVLWQLRVLAGWLPPTGGRLARVLAAGFERDNIVGLASRLAGRPAPAPFDLGALTTAWPQLRGVASPGELDGAIARGPWAAPSQPLTAQRSGSPFSASPPPLPLRDRLTGVWLRRLEGALPDTRPWREGFVVVLAARNRLLDRTPPGPDLVADASPVIGRRWETARTLDELREALAPRAREILARVDSADELWRAEAALRRRTEDDGFAWLRSGRQGPRAVAGGLAVLAADAWRVRAALASAAHGGAVREVLDVLA